MGTPVGTTPSRDGKVFPQRGPTGMSLWELSPLDTCVVDDTAGLEIASHTVE